MENATKALIIAAGVLIGIMMASLGVYLYYTLGSYVSETQQEIEQNSINKFNTQFLKYNNVKVDENGRAIKDADGNLQTEFKVTIQDIITVANLAYENNTNYNLTSADASPTTLYVKVNAPLYNSEGTLVNTSNLEEKVNTQSANWLSYAYNKGYEYTCEAKDIKISTETGRVYEITFK